MPPSGGKSGEKKLKASKHRIVLHDGRELQYHNPQARAEPIDLRTLIPKDWTGELEVEIGPGKGEFMAARAAAWPQRLIIGIDRRADRYDLTEKKLKRIGTGAAPAPTPGADAQAAPGGGTGADGVSSAGGATPPARNWVLLREDARRLLDGGLPPIRVLHVYQPDPWPKARHHKHRFFRSPDARRWAESIVSGGELRFSTDHRDYFDEITDIVLSWKLFQLGVVIEKRGSEVIPSTHFEKIFLKKGLPVYKAVFVRA